MFDKMLVVDAEYVNNLSLKIHYSDGTSNVIDFEPFLRSHPHPQTDKYLNPQNFKCFSIIKGNVIWGENWDMIFPVEDLYSGKLS